MNRIFPILAFFLVSYAPASPSSKQSSWEQIRGIAEAQHEICLLLIKNREYDKVLPGCKKIFDLDFPKDQLFKLVESAKIIVDALIHHDQYAIAHQVLDEAIKEVDSDRAKASLYREKAYVFTKEGKDNQAVKLFQKAMELEKSNH